MPRLFGPCREESLDPIHTACAFFNDLSGEVCNCPCHTPEDIERRLAKLNIKPVSEDSPPECAHCNKPITQKKIIDRMCWVHVHSGQMYCTSMLATPKGS